MPRYSGARWRDLNGYVESVTWDVREAINRFLRLATEKGFTKRNQIRTFLEQHEDRPKLLALLLERDSRNWKRYVERELAHADPGADEAPET